MRRALLLVLCGLVVFGGCSSSNIDRDHDDTSTVTVTVAAIYRNDDGTVRVERHQVAPADEAELRATLAADPAVVVTGRDATASVQVTVPAASLSFGSEWALDRVGAPAAWEAGHTGEGVRVAVIDTGVDATHHDLAGRVVDVYSAFEGPGTVDPAGHGTHVAGIVAAGQGGPDTTGVAPAATVLAARVLDADGFGNHSDIAAGIIAAVDAGADVINLSLGGPEHTDVLAAGVRYALDRGVVVVAAAGNDNSATPSFPATYDGVIAVAATTRGDSRAPFSNTGLHLDLSAPGFAITSTVPVGHREVLSGTSQAAPFVAGAAALTIDSGVPRSQVPARLISTAGALGDQSLFGAGMVDASAATGGPATEPGLRLGPPTLPDLDAPTLPTFDAPTVPDFGGIDRPSLTPQDRPTAPDLGPTPGVDLGPTPELDGPDRPATPGDRPTVDPTVDRPDVDTPASASGTPTVTCNQVGVCVLEGFAVASEVTVRVAGVEVVGSVSGDSVRWHTWLSGPVTVTVGGHTTPVTVEPRAAVSARRVADGVSAVTFGPPHPVTVRFDELLDGVWAPVSRTTGLGAVSVAAPEASMVRPVVTTDGAAPLTLAAWSVRER